MLLATIAKDKVEDLSKQDVFYSIYPRNTAYREMKVYHQLNRLGNLLWKFFAVRELESNPLEQELYTIKYANRIGQDRLFRQRAKAMINELNQEGVLDTEQSLIAYQLNQLVAYRTQEDVFNRAYHLQAMNNHLDAFYFERKLLFGYQYLVNITQRSAAYEATFIDELLILVEEHEEHFKRLKGVEFYYRGVKTLTEQDNTEHYEFLKSLLEQYEELPRGVAMNIYGFCTNYCIRGISKGVPEYSRELFTIYQLGIEGELVYSNGWISEWDYRNILTLGCALGEYEWTETFLESHYERLNESVRDNAYHYCKALYLYTRLRYEESTNYLLQVSFTNSRYHLQGMLLRLRISYDQNEYTLFLNDAETLRLYVLRSPNMSASDKRAYSNFIRFAKKLVLIQESRPYARADTTRKQLELLKEKIEQNDNVINRAWLLQACAF
ncbi:MAG: hypothetical protein AAF433_13615 [Bacteroidota bacterium]